MKAAAVFLHLSFQMVIFTCLGFGVGWNLKEYCGAGTWIYIPMGLAGFAMGMYRIFAYAKKHE